MNKISYSELRQFSYHIFLAMGCSEEDALLASEVLVGADLRGVDSHGVARLSGYVRLWDIQRIQSKPNIRIVHETPTTATIDGDSGLGLVVAPRAMEIAIEKADKYGSGWVSVKNSNHFGIAGYHAMMALEHDMIGMAMTNASPLVSPTFSVERLLGTNPIAVAIPAGEEKAFVADMATTTAANGKLEIAQRMNKPIPYGWAQTKEGGKTDDAHALKQGGALLPLGSERESGSHKGYALGAIVDIFSAVLSGANYGPWVPPFVPYADTTAEQVGQGIGHFLGAMRIDGFRTKEEFKKNMDNWIRRFKASKTVEGQERVIIPGEPEFAFQAERMAHGIPLHDAVWQDLQKLSERFAVKL